MDLIRLEWGLGLDVRFIGKFDSLVAGLDSLVVEVGDGWRDSLRELVGWFFEDWIRGRSAGTTVRVWFELVYILY